MIVVNIIVQANAAHADVRHAHVSIGSNIGIYPRFKAKIPAANGVRIYYDSTDPSRWPDSCPRLDGRPWMLISFRPMPGALFSGSLDKWFRNWFAGCPHHTDVTIWHENANGEPGCLVGSCNPLGYPKILRDPARFRHMQRHMLWLARGTHVRIGTIGCGPVAQAPEWYARGLDWYGNDLYLNARYLTGGGLRKAAVLAATAGGTLSKEKVWARMTANLRAFQKVSGQRYPRIDLGESNASPDSYRKAWFSDLVSWFDSHDGRRPARILTFWRDGKSAYDGGLSGPWPPSAGVEQKLQWLALSHR
jgi:hypothetical protein